MVGLERNQLRVITLAGTVGEKRQFDTACGEGLALLFPGEKISQTGTSQCGGKYDDLHRDEKGRGITLLII